MAKECGVHEYGPLTRNWSFELSQLERFAALVRAEREWVDLTDDEVLKSLGANSYDEYSERELANAVLDARAVITAFKEKNK